METGQANILLRTLSERNRWLHHRGHCVHLPRIMPQLVRLVHKGHCVRWISEEYK